LLSPTTTTAPTAPTAPTPEPEPESESESESAVESTGIEQEVISKEDGKKIREIATVWWNEFYPEQMQSLISQMFGWGAPGTKYSVEIINQWLEGEDDLIRDRIGEIIKLKSTQK
jgi:putative DNA primase/helicase